MRSSSCGVEPFSLLAHHQDIIRVPLVRAITEWSIQITRKRDGFIEVAVVMMKKKESLWVLSDGANDDCDFVS
ncbi:hypothetical protein F2Q69_00046851 [Brassica cretica]|uniref:Uncharacterized protein n=1 Tax=Brassica cretica TaxID=69181 RepID=A0A8S9PP32_BRACR|nr:hypothetical protein F2Q69_00046851 [Brassica cretica]